MSFHSVVPGALARIRAEFWLTSQSLGEQELLLASPAGDHLPPSPGVVPSTVPPPPLVGHMEYIHAM